MSIALFLHVVSAVVWVGGMFLAYVAVRPAAIEELQPRERLRLWCAIFRRFFPWVWAAVVLILATGLLMMAEMAALPPYVIVMAALGVVMSAIFVYIYFVPYAALKRTVSAEDWNAAARALARIRILVGINLSLGLINVAVALLGRGFQ